MSESPSIYLPRQRRPRKLSDAADWPASAVGVGEMRAEHKFQNTQRMPSYQSTESVKKSRGITPTSIQVSSGNHIANSVSISGALGRQIRQLASSSIDVSDGAPTLCAFLLGYLESDGSIQLNRLDQGISIDGRRVPTAVYSTDMVIPLYHGESRAKVYARALQPGNIFSIAGWLASSQSNGYSGVALEFIGTSCSASVSIEPTSPIDISSLPALLTCISRDSMVRQGALHYEDGTNVPKTEPLLPPERTVWVCLDSSNDETAIATAYIDAGLPRSLHIAQITPENNYRSALVQHCLVAPLAGTTSISVRVASTELAPSAASTAKFISATRYGNGVLGILHTIASQHRIEIWDTANVEATPVVPRSQPSPLLEKIVASTQALVTPASRSLSKDATPKQPTSRNTHKEATNSDISELLKEQRHIRTLLEEQNNLIKAHVSQTQELVRLAQYQPSPQTVTRRYLRMKGTHTPTITSTHRRTSDAGRAAISTEDGFSTHSMRRSNSLTEIVDGIRSFEVEGYEETEHRPLHAKRNSLTFASPIYAGGNSLTLESPSYSESTDAKFSTTSSINNLVTRINRLSGSSSKATIAQSRAFERPPLPAYGRIQAPSSSHGSKVTPTTQKYLDSLMSQDAAPPNP
ncbi:hypothetical protein BX667DRAFT_496661 [Coemansia mojavensis]|nr:hypothetical protein BX667DRAFT_496661 [Coemansia mojavensis]